MVVIYPELKLNYCSEAIYWTRPGAICRLLQLESVPTCSSVCIDMIGLLQYTVVAMSNNKRATGRFLVSHGHGDKPLLRIPAISNPDLSAVKLFSCVFRYFRHDL